MDRNDQKLDDDASGTTDESPLQDLPPKPLDDTATDDVRGGFIKFSGVDGEATHKDHTGII